MIFECLEKMKSAFLTAVKYRSWYLVTGLIGSNPNLKPILVMYP